MFYRRKILLAVIEAFGGFLPRTDCQKLLFLFCARRSKNYYDFFPHKFGNFSLVLSQDHDKLADLGLLTSHSDFQLQEDQSYREQISKKDLDTLQALVAELGNQRGEELIRKVYLEFPQYASRSKIATTLLNHFEYEQASTTWRTDRTSKFFTIGYEGITIDAYLNLLIINNIQALVDVRKNPISRKFGFSKTQLSHAMNMVGIKYIHLSDLGVPSNLRQGLDNKTAYQNLFDHYASQILPANMDALESLKTIVKEYNRVAITCFEADHRFCHRHKVAEYLENDPNFTAPIIHLKQ